MLALRPSEITVADIGLAIEESRIWFAVLSIRKAAKSIHPAECAVTLQNCRATSRVFLPPQPLLHCFSALNTNDQDIHKLMIKKRLTDSVDTESSLPDILLKGITTHNLQNITVRIPRNRFVVLTGVSGSGKSSLAFDTLYAEGHRRYVESLSAYVRQFLERMPRPEIESVEGIAPAIAIEQKPIPKIRVQRWVPCRKFMTIYGFCMRE